MHLLINPTNSCAFTGYRPEKLPWGSDEKSLRCVSLKESLARTVEQLISSGIRHFICGMARGCDTYFCEAVLDLRKTYPLATIEAAVPYRGQESRWLPNEIERYFGLLALCDLVTYVSEEYSRNCMMKRNRYMVKNASVLIAVFDGQPGGTKNTVDYAVKKGFEVIMINP